VFVQIVLAIAQLALPVCVFSAQLDFQERLMGHAFRVVLILEKDVLLATKQQELVTVVFRDMQIHLLAVLTLTVFQMLPV